MTRAGLLALAFGLGAAAGCGADVDPPWQLDHDRVIAVRANPPRIVSGETSQLDALLGRLGAPPVETEPATADVLSPRAVASSLVQDGTHWRFTAPDAATIEAARAELALEAGAPVPVRLRVTFAETDKVALKLVWLGEHRENPALGPVLVDGVDASAAAELTVAPQVDVPLAVDFGDDHQVNWLTSCGTMHDFDLPAAYLRVEPEDPQSGTLAVVVRDELGGVVWRTWPITAE